MENGSRIKIKKKLFPSLILFKLAAIFRMSQCDMESKTTENKENKIFICIFIHR